jgi:hypothetical protein
MRRFAFVPKSETLESRLALSGDLVTIDGPGPDSDPLPDFGPPATGPLPERSSGPLGGNLDSGSDPFPQLDRNNPADINLGLIGFPEPLPEDPIYIPPPVILPPDSGPTNTGAIA